MTSTTPLTDVKVVVMDNVTIVEGTDTVYRYDLSTEGILDGWALPALIEQIKVLSPARYPNCDVQVDGMPAACERLVGALRGQGVAAWSPQPDVAEAPEPTAVLDYRPQAGSHPPTLIRPLLIAAVALLVLVGGIYAVRTFTSDRPLEHVASAPTSRVPAALASPSAQPSSAVKAVPEPPAPAPVPGLTGVVAVIPAGFTSREQAPEGMVSLEAPSGDLRVHLSRETLVDQDPAAAIASINAEVAAAPDMQPSAPPGLRDAPETAYIEEPGDGSVVLWFIWAEGTDLLSVGCHTKGAPTMAQRVTCRSIAGDMTIVGEPGT